MFFIFFKKSDSFHRTAVCCSLLCIIFLCRRTTEHLSANIHMPASASVFFSVLKSSRENRLEGESKQIIEERHNSSVQVGSMDSTCQAYYSLVRNCIGATMPCQGWHEQHIRG